MHSYNYNEVLSSYSSVLTGSNADAFFAKDSADMIVISVIFFGAANAVQTHLCPKQI